MRRIGFRTPVMALTGMLSASPALLLSPAACRYSMTWASCRYISVQYCRYRKVSCTPRHSVKPAMLVEREAVSSIFAHISNSSTSAAALRVVTSGSPDVIVFVVVVVVVVVAKDAISGVIDSSLVRLRKALLNTVYNVHCLLASRSRIHILWDYLRVGCRPAMHR
ncbi:hypothetical protein F4825DRAFT_405421 [Nemania diffusa]|nr:hypothetical protein F4825DRAFT_405421 [Nemania diffusa]